jgi:ParB-like chromosome segregation protein Spo0J
LAEQKGEIMRNQSQHIRQTGMSLEEPSTLEAPKRRKPMRVDLRTLQPNPMRDFTIDPIDPEAVERLRQSIAEDGFWGGIVCRQLPDGTLQIGAGHHRVAAALEAGITTADVFVAEDMDDATMVRVYARENATQRGNTSTALAGAVASAVRYLAKVILTGGSQKFLGTLENLEVIRGNLTSEKGLGEDVLLKFLQDIPGMTLGSVRHQLANLKTSGDYTRLIADIAQEIAAEEAAAQAALEEAECERERLQREQEEAERQHQTAEARTAAERRVAVERHQAEVAAWHQVTAEAQTMARQAATTAAKHPQTFDFHGVARHLKNPHQVDVFRALATKKTALGQMAIGEQEQFAAYLVEYCQAHGYELSGATIRLHFHEALRQARAQFFRFARLEQEAREQEDPFYALERAALRFGEHLRGLTSAGWSISRQLREWPKERQAPVVPVTFERDLREALTILTRLSKERGFSDEPDDDIGKRPLTRRALLPAGQKGPRPV